MKRTFLLALVLLGFGISGTAVPAISAGPFVIPVDLPLTGAGSFFGQDQAQILRLYEKHVNEQGGIHGTPVQFQFLDDQSSPQVAVQLVTSALGNKPAAVLGGGTLAACLAIAPQFANGPVQYCLSPAMHPAAGSYTFAGYMSSVDITIAAARYFHATGWRRIALIAPTDASGDGAVHDIGAVIDQWPDHDLKIVDVERFNPSDVSVSAQIARLKATSPQVVIGFASGTPFGTILHALNDAGLDLPVFTSSANTTSQQLAQYAGFLPTTLLANGSTYDMRDLLSRGPLKDACTELARVLRAAGVADPGATELFTWDVAKITVSALRALPAGASAQQLRDYILALHGFAGVNGLYDFRSGNQHGLTDSSVVLVRWDQQKKVMVPASRPGGVPLSGR